MQHDEPRQNGLAAHAPLSGGPSSLRERVVDTSLMLAEQKGSWSAVRLHDVADRLSVPTPEILNHYRDLDAVADAWFQRGKAPVLSLWLKEDRDWTNHQAYGRGGYTTARNPHSE